MVIPSVDDVIKKLDGFSSMLLSYRQQLDWYDASDDEGRSRALIQLRYQTQKVAREAGGAQPIVEAVLGKYLVRLGEEEWDPWSEAFMGGIENPKLSHSLHTVNTLVSQTVGRLQSEPLIDLVTRPIQPQSIQRPKVFIAHDGESELRTALEVECWRMMLEPVVAEEQVSLNESVDRKVGRLLDQCQFAVVLARIEKGVKQDNHTMPRGNIIDEISRVRTKLGDKYVILLEQGLSLPTNLSTGVVWEPFDQTNFDGAILKVIKSLRAHHLL